MKSKINWSNVVAFIIPTLVFAAGCLFIAWAVLKDRNGKFMFIELGHCSCYGPLEERNPKCIYSLEEIIKLLDRHCKDTYGGYAKAVAEKLKELEG